MKFEKWQALGNDYLIVERGELAFELTPARVRRLCDGRLGVGADGVLLLSPASSPEHVADLRIFNRDGSEAELSGNGAREAILYLRRRGWTDADEFVIATVAGPIRPMITGPDTCTLDMGTARLSSKDFPDGPPDGRGVAAAAGREWSFRHVSIGNPQCAIHVGSERELAALDLSAIGPPIEGDRRFPNRTNVSWYTELAPARADRAARVRARIFERGVGETLSSGTGATGAAVAYVLDARERTGGQTRAQAGPVSPPAGASGDHRPGADTVTVVLDGGELRVDVGADLHVSLTGWARPVYAGRLSDELTNELKEMHETE